MAVESASWGIQLVTTNPTSVDPRSEGDDHLRLIKSVLQSELAWDNRQWVYTGDAISWVNANSFTLTGDHSTKYQLGRRLKVTGNTTGTIYGYVSSSTYSASTRVNMTWDTSAGMSQETLTPYVGALSADNHSIPFQAGDFTPEVSCDTAGDLAAVASSSEGEYIRLGRWVYVHMTWKGSITYTTATGNIRLGTLPVPKPADVNTTLLNGQAFCTTDDVGLTYPTGVTEVKGFIESGTDYGSLFGNGDGGYNSAFKITDFASGKNYVLRIDGIYTV